MFNRKTVAAILVIGFLGISAGFAQDLKDNWNDFLHYTKIGRLDLAAGYAQAVLDSNPDPVELLALSEKNPAGLSILLTTAMTCLPSANAFFSTKRVCGIHPSNASTSSSTLSTIVSTRSTSPPKSACPGVSTMLIFTP